MELRSIEQNDLASAETLLRRGFPGRGPVFWGERLATLQSHRARFGLGPIGSLLSMGGEDVGVLLFIESPRAAQRINLSSWFVEERARLAAARMLQRATAGSAVYTDLTPTMAVRSLNERLGIKPIRVGSMLAPTPLDALRLGKGRVRGFGSAAAGSLPAEDRTLLADHEALGLLTAVLTTDEGCSPLIFMPTRVRGLPGARVIHARNRTILQVYRGAIARYLMSHQLLFLELEANRYETWPGALYAPRRTAVFAKGPIDLDAIDHTYSELAFLHPH